MFFLIKILFSAMIIAIISEIAKRSTVLAAILVAAPITSLITFFWMWLEKNPSEEIATLSWQIVLASIPSVLFCSALAVFIKKGIGFGGALVISVGIMIVCQILYLLVLQRFGVKIV